MSEKNKDLMFPRVNDLQLEILTILKMLDKVESDLDSAKGWGFLDIINGGLFTSLFKHGKINDAESRLKLVKTKLEDLQKELEFIDIPLDHVINDSNLNKFLDIAFDNIFSDLYTQSRISRGLQEVQSVREILESIHYDLMNLTKYN